MAHQLFFVKGGKEEFSEDLDDDSDDDADDEDDFDGASGGDDEW